MKTYQIYRIPPSKRQGMGLMAGQHVVTEPARFILISYEDEQEGVILADTPNLVAVYENLLRDAGVGVPKTTDVTDGMIRMFLRKPQ